MELLNIFRNIIDCTICGTNFRTLRSTNDMWHAIQLHYSEQSYNRSPWENDHKSKLVKPILMKPIVLEQGQMRLPKYKILDIEEW